MKRNWTTRVTLLLTAGILVVVNLISVNWFERADLTDDNVYSLSDASIDLVRSLDDPVTIKAFFTKDLPAPYSANRRMLQDKLDEYRAYGGNNIQYDFVDPTDSDELKEQAERYRIPTVQIQVVENDNLQIKNAYMGLAIQYQDEREVIGVVQELSNLEYQITTAIKKMQRDKLPVVGFLQGDGEPDPTKVMSKLMEQLRKRLDVRTVTIAADSFSTMPDLLIVVAPKDTIPDEHLQVIDRFMQNQGKAAFFLNRVEANLQQGFGTVVNTGLERLLESYGAHVNPDLVMDKQSSAINVQRQAGFFRVMEAVQYPFLPIVTSFSDNAMVRRLGELRLFFASSIDTTEVPAGVSIQPLAFSTEQSQLQTGFFMLQPQAVQNRDLSGGPYTLAAAYSGHFPSPYGIDGSATESRMVVVGDGDFVDESLAGPIPSSIELVQNAIDWLSLDEDILAIRSKKIDPRPLEPVEDSLKAPIKYFTLLFPPFLVVLVGLFRWRRRKYEARSTN